MFSIAAQYYSYNTSYHHTDWWLGIGIGLAAYLVFAIFVLARVFEKAGRSGWVAIVPFYNQWVLAEIGGKPGWWGLYSLVAWVPIAGWLVALAASLLIALGVARNFDKSTSFGVIGLWLFSLIGYIMLAFGSAQYRGADNGKAPPTDVPRGPTA